MILGGGLWILLLLPLLLVVLLAALVILTDGTGAVVADKERVERDSSGSVTDKPSRKVCPKCGRALQPDWQVCPYDSTCVDRPLS
jgi:hypothetical protein